MKKLILISILIILIIILIFTLKILNANNLKKMQKLVEKGLDILFQLTAFVIIMSLIYVLFK